MNWFDEVVCNARIETVVYFGLAIALAFVLGWAFAAMCASAKWGDSWNK